MYVSLIESYGYFHATLVLLHSNNVFPLVEPGILQVIKGIFQIIHVFLLRHYGYIHNISVFLHRIDVFLLIATELSHNMIFTIL